MTSSPIVQPTDMTEQEKAYVQKTYPGINLSGKPKKRKYVSKPPKAKSASSSSKFHQVVARPWYHIILWVLVGVSAYVCHGLGWILGHVSRACRDCGNYLHEFKWRLGKK